MLALDSESEVFSHGAFRSLSVGAGLGDAGERWEGCFQVTLGTSEERSADHKVGPGLLEEARCWLCEELLQTRDDLVKA